MSSRSKSPAPRGAAGGGARSKSPAQQRWAKATIVATAAAKFSRISHEQKLHNMLHEFDDSINAGRKSLEHVHQRAHSIVGGMPHRLRLLAGLFDVAFLVFMVILVQVCLTCLAGLDLHVLNLFCGDDNVCSSSDFARFYVDALGVDRRTWRPWLTSANALRDDFDESSQRLMDSTRVSLGAYLEPLFKDSWELAFAWLFSGLVLVLLACCAKLFTQGQTPGKALFGLVTVKRRASEDAPMRAQASLLLRTRVAS